MRRQDRTELELVKVMKEAEIFTCEFFKRNGETRRMECEFVSFTNGVITVKDLEIDQFRSIRMDSIFDLDLLLDTEHKINIEQTITIKTNLNDTICYSTTAQDVRYLNLLLDNGVKIELCTTFFENIENKKKHKVLVKYKALVGSFKYRGQRTSAYNRYQLTFNTFLNNVSVKEAA